MYNLIGSPLTILIVQILHAHSVGYISFEQNQIQQTYATVYRTQPPQIHCITFLFKLSVFCCMLQCFDNQKDVVVAHGQFTLNVKVRYSYINMYSFVLQCLTIQYSNYSIYTVGIACNKIFQGHCSKSSLTTFIYYLLSVLNCWTKTWQWITCACRSATTPFVHMVLFVRVGLFPG